MDAAIDITRQHLIDPEMCARCGGCEEACPRGAILHDFSNYAVDPQRCEGGGDCLKVCTTGAIDNWRVVERRAMYPLEEQLSWSRLPEPRTSSEASPGPAFPRATRPASAAAALVNLYTLQSPAQLIVARNVALTQPANGAEVRHIVLDCGTSAFKVLEGQSIGIIPPGFDAAGRAHHVRLYSVASARDGEDPGCGSIALTVKRVLRDHAGHAVRGVCSNYLCDLPAGSAVRATGPVGESFLMPDERGAPLLMICTGTGIAPMRAMLSRRLRTGDARRTDLRLIYGGRTPSELPYRLELEAIPAERLDMRIGYSRSTEHAKRYVQDLLREDAVQIGRMIVERGATVYVCGLSAMERAVRETLGEILGAAGYDWAALESEMSATGRFHVEVY